MNKLKYFRVFYRFAGKSYYERFVMSVSDPVRVFKDFEILYGVGNVVVWCGYHWRRYFDFWSSHVLSTDTN